MTKTASELFYEYVNDWLSVERMAEYYQMDPKALAEKINEGRPKWCPEVIQVEGVNFGIVIEAKEGHTNV